jgi:hypothetical protein
MTFYQTPEFIVVLTFHKCTPCFFTKRTLQFFMTSKRVGVTPIPGHSQSTESGPTLCENTGILGGIVSGYVVRKAPSNAPKGTPECTVR